MDRPDPRYGKILLNLMGAFNGFALVLLTVTDGRASGRFLRQTGGFMPRRTNLAVPHEYTVVIAEPGSGISDGHTELDPAELYSDSTWGLLAQTTQPGVVSRQVYVDDNENLGTEFATSGGAWALVHHDRTEAGYLVRQAGPRRIWDELATLHQQWCVRGRPGYDRFGITLNTDATALWLDEPDGPRWERHIDGHMPVPR